MASSKPIVSASFSYETLEETLDIKAKGAQLLIGIPKEQMFQENRVALTPDAVSVLVNNGHRVVIEYLAGEGSHYTDKDFSEAGAKIAYERKEVYQCDMLIKSAPVTEQELELLTPGQTIISPLHVAVMKSGILEGMMEKRITALSFENLKDDSGNNPIVRSMSEIAGSDAYCRSIPQQFQ
jgi:alanine dehydrogenase